MRILAEPIGDLRSLIALGDKFSGNLGNRRLREYLIEIRHPVTRGFHFGRKCISAGSGGPLCGAVCLFFLLFQTFAFHHLLEPVCVVLVWIVGICRFQSGKLGFQSLGFGARERRLSLVLLTFSVQPIVSLLCSCLPQLLGDVFCGLSLPGLAGLSTFSARLLAFCLLFGNDRGGLGYTRNGLWGRRGVLFHGILVMLYFQRLSAGRRFTLGQLAVGSILLGKCEVAACLIVILTGI